MAKESQSADPTIIILEGDQTGQELLEQALRVLDPAVSQVPLSFERFNLSLPNRQKTKNQIVFEAAEAIQRTGLGLKAATITPADPDDVGSPNALLREALNADVILRTGRRIPNVRPVGGVHAPISVVRMAVGGAYGAEEWREQVDGDEFAFRTERISRSVCRSVAEFSFQHAEKTGSKVFGGPKFTVSHTYESMFKEELDAAANRHPSVVYEPQLIDATYALLLQNAGDAMVIPTLNRDGDCMSDLVLQMYGSIAGSESLVLSIDDQAMKVESVMAEAPHGTAPALEGKNLANPMAMILAGAALFTYLGSKQADHASRAIYESVFEALYEGTATPDMGGHSGTTEFTDEVIRRVTTKLEVWTSIG